MIKIIKELKIEVSKPNIFQAVVAKQYDMNTRFIKATLVDGDNVIEIPKRTDNSIKVVINAERPDGTKDSFEGEVSGDDTVTVPLHSWMLEIEGTVICDISIIDMKTDDNKKLTTTSFTLLVEKAAYGGADITNDPQYDVLISLLETCSEAGGVAQEALNKSNEALAISNEANAKYEACVEATENANAVREEIEAGGYIESLKELNEGGKFSFWVGTQAEYDAISEKVRNCFYIITDDITQSKDYAGCYYRTVNNEREWINPPMINGIEYRTTERKDGNPVYVKRISKTYTENIGDNDGLSDYNIPHGVSNLTKLIRCETIANNIAQFPFISTTGGLTSVNTVDNTNIVLRIYKDVWTPSTFVFDIAYTKGV